MSKPRIDGFGPKTRETFELSAPEEHIHSVHRGSVDAELDLTRPRIGLRDINDLQHLWRPESLIRDGLHGLLFCEAVKATITPESASVRRDSSVKS